jgi:AraC-like DNA-binding protein/mannose-6-phosphate isomerase-like protein (cupin superfamily)
MEKYLLEHLSEESEEEAGILGGEVLNRKIYAGGDDFVVNEARLFGPRQSISARTHTRYVDFPLHKHNYVEMMIVLSGSITHEIDGEELTLGKGEVLVMNKHVTHSIRHSGRDDIGVNIIMSDRFIDGVAGELAGTVFSSLIKENSKESGAPIYLAFRTGERKYLENAIENLLFELTVRGRDVGVMSGTVSLLLRYLSLENDELLIRGNLKADKEDARRLEILSYVKSNYRTASLAELSERLYLTVPYLSKVIKESFAKSFKELVVDERMERAKAAIEGTSLPIGDVIRGVGYENESYFHREFKERYGVTPLTMRKKAAVEIKRSIPT